MTHTKSMNTTQMNFRATLLEKKTKGSFLKPFRKQGCGKGDRNCTSLPLIWWTLNFPKHDSPRQDMEESCKTQLMKPVPSIPSASWKRKSRSELPPSSRGPPPAFKLPKHLPSLFSSSTSSIRIPQDWGKARWKLYTNLPHTKQHKTKGNLNNTSEPPWVHYQV